MFYGFADLLLLALVVFLWVAWRRIARLTRRIEALEARLRAPDAAAPAVEIPDEVLPESPAPAGAEGPVAGQGGWAPAAPRQPSRSAALMGEFALWLRKNWIYPVAGAALVMAAIYLLQYSIDKGLLSPLARVVLALGLGAALILAAEWMRRRWGAEDGGARLVPPTLAGAGIAAMFAAILAAYHLYAVLGAGATLISLTAVALLSMALGWAQGPFLAALGVIAASAAPFLLGRGDAPMPLLYGYFGAVALLGLGIDGLKRWGWVSGLAVVLPLAGGVLIRMAGAPGWGLAALALGIVLLALALPGGALVPRAEGPMLSQWRRARPSAPVLVAGLAVLGAAAAIVWRVEAPEGVLAAGLLAMILPLWTRHAPALRDLALPAAAALPASIGYSLIGTPLMLSMGLNLTPWLPLAALALATLAGLAMIWRSEEATGGARAFWALLGIATPGASAIAAELVWQPATLLGGRWAMSLMALAALHTALALWLARRDAGQGLRLGAAVSAAFTLIALALMVLLSDAALTLALAVLLVSAAAMDRRFGIPQLGWILGLGAMTLGWRLAIWPGLDAMLSPEFSDLDVALTLLAVLAGPLAALALLRGLPAQPSRDWGRIITETALSGIVPVALVLVFARFLEEISGHAGLGIEASVLIALAAVQARRARLLAGSRAMHLVRRALAFLLGLAAAFCLVLALTALSPILGDGFLAGSVQGWPLVNDLALAYAAPAAVLFYALRGAAGRWARAGRLVSLALGAYWIAAVIRHLWQGNEQMALRHGFAQGELYAYTVALLIGGAVFLALALQRGVTAYRIAGMALVGFAAAKAFLVDAAGLSGLMRVGAFLGLGLSLAALAWLNAWVAARVDGADGEGTSPS